MITVSEYKPSLLARTRSANKNLIADKLCGFSPANQSRFRVRPARDYQEAVSLFRLVYREYLIREFCRPHPSGLHCSHYSFFPESKILMLEGSGETFGTLTLIPDTRCGLPMEKIFPAEIESIRGKGRRPAEISMLAFDLELLRTRKYLNADIQRFSCAFFLFKGMFHYARENGLTDLVMAVHPRLESLYRSLGFKRRGDVKAYSSALGKPAVAMHMNIPDWMRNTSVERKMKHYFLADREILQEEKGEGLEWDPLYVRMLLTGREVPADAQSFLKQHYPGITF